MTLDKSCSMCKSSKPLDAFGVARDKRFGRKSRCKDCEREARAANRDTERARFARWYAANGDEVRRKEYVRRHSYLSVDQTEAMPEFDFSQPLTYRGAHDRVHRWRGAARIHACGHCGAQAEEWAYGHRGVHEMHEVRPKWAGRQGVHAYSPDPLDYIPLCRSCHTAFDKGLAAC